MTLIYGKDAQSENIKKILKELEIQKVELEKFKHYSDYDRGLFQGKISMINIIMKELEKLLIDK